MLLIPPDLDRRTGPARGTAIRGIILGALAPGILLWLAIAGIGRLLTGPLIGWNRSESALNRSLQNTRDRTWDSVTALWSHIGNTEIVIGSVLSWSRWCGGAPGAGGSRSSLPSPSACRRPSSSRRRP